MVDAGVSIGLRSGAPGGTLVQPYLTLELKAITFVFAFSLSFPL